MSEFEGIAHSGVERTLMDVIDEFHRSLVMDDDRRIYAVTVGGGGFMVTDVLYNESISSRWKPIRRDDGDVVGGGVEMGIHFNYLRYAEISCCYHATAREADGVYEITCSWPPTIYRLKTDDGRYVDYRIDICWKCTFEGHMEKFKRDGEERKLLKYQSELHEYEEVEYERGKRLGRERERVSRHFIECLRGRSNGYDGMDYAAQIWCGDIKRIRGCREITSVRGWYT
jgi:hypothetical protein